MVADTALTRPPERTAEQILSQAKRDVLKRALRDYEAHESKADLFELSVTRANLYEAVRELKAMYWKP